MKTTFELARETAEDEIDQYFARLRNDPETALIGDAVQSALDAQAAQYREAIKVAVDALERCRNSWVFYVNSPNAPIASIASMDGAIENAIATLSKISELTPKP